MISRIVAFARTLLALLFWIIFIPPAALIAFPWTLITGKIEFLYSVGMWLAFAAPRVAGVKVKLVGLDKIDPAGTYIFMSNHVSNLDPPILVPLIPGRTSVLAKERDLEDSHREQGAGSGGDRAGGAQQSRFSDQQHPPRW